MSTEDLVICRKFLYKNNVPIISQPTAIIFVDRPDPSIFIEWTISDTTVDSDAYYYSTITDSSGNQKTWSSTDTTSWSAPGFAV